MGTASLMQAGWIFVCAGPRGGAFRNSLSPHLFSRRPAPTESKKNPAAANCRVLFLGDQLLHDLPTRVQAETSAGSRATPPVLATSSRKRAARVRPALAVPMLTAPSRLGA